MGTLLLPYVTEKFSTTCRPTFILFVITKVHLFYHLFSFTNLPAGLQHDYDNIKKLGVVHPLKY